MQHARTMLLLLNWDSELFRVSLAFIVYTSIIHVSRPQQSKAVDLVDILHNSKEFRKEFLNFI